MDRGDVLSGAAFTAVLRSAIAFVVVLVVFGWAALAYVERSLVAELGGDVQQRWSIIAADHRSEGRDAGAGGEHVEPLARCQRVVDQRAGRAEVAGRGIGDRGEVQTEALVELGAQPDIRVAATHPVFIPPALERLAHKAISEVIVTDTIPYSGHLGKVNVLSVAPLLALPSSTWRRRSTARSMAA